MTERSKRTTAKTPPAEESQHRNDEGNGRQPARQATPERDAEREAKTTSPEAGRMAEGEQKRPRPEDTDSSLGSGTDDPYGRAQKMPPRDDQPL